MYTHFFGERVVTLYTGKLRKITLALLILYTILIFYLLFIGFNRSSYFGSPNLAYNLIPKGIPLHLPMGRDFQIWFFELGNFIAFLPFGVVIPLLFRCNFIRFIILFLFSITVLETLQMFLRLGSFDIDDILVNTLGAAVGFWAQQLVQHDRNKVNGIFRISLIAFLISVGTVTIVGNINHYLEKGSGEFEALNELTLINGDVLWDESLSSFSLGQNKVTPQINLYSRKNARRNEFSYLLNGQYINLSGYVAIPDDIINTVGKGRSDILFIADGTVIYNIGLSANRGETMRVSFQTPLDGANVLTIKITNDEQTQPIDTIMWDITLEELNTGQKIINSIKNRLRSLY
ncbi:VanZ family protein [Bacillus sp. 2205SS5-2]|uniref:VanZ family protein n=1 Tax=Bacillus sp. 2205SS5-2 TaxID=3109031 RepID=UPI0030067455